MLAAFWASARGYVAEPGYDSAHGASIIDPQGIGPAIGWLRVPEEKAVEQYVNDAGGSIFGHVIMLDPEGNEDCVA